MTQETEDGSVDRKGVGPRKHKETGEETRPGYAWRDINLKELDLDRIHPIFEGIDDDVRVEINHWDHVEIPEDARDNVRVVYQDPTTGIVYIVQVGEHHFGFQLHIERTDTGRQLLKNAFNYCVEKAKQRSEEKVEHATPGMPAIMDDRKEVVSKPSMMKPEVDLPLEGCETLEIEPPEHEVDSKPSMMTPEVDLAQKQKTKQIKKHLK